MTLSKRDLEGYLLIDHTDSPGISAEVAAQAGNDTLAVPAGMKFQSATINCSHCQVLVVLNPKRDRSRGYCPKCDRYICDQCEAVRVQTGVCKTFNQMVDEIIEKAVKGT
jgi:hypothetical protein